jgi:hypothetical protein
MSEEKKLGVDLVKKAIKFIYDIVDESIDALKDKKISLSEVLGFSDNAYSGVIIGLKSKELWAEIKDIDTEEGVELAVYIGELVKDATSDDIDIIIKNAIEAIEAEIAIYEKNIVPMIETIKSLKK